MSYTKDPNPELNDLGLWYSRSGMKSILFAILQGSVSSANSSIGYLDEISTPKNKDIVVINLKKIYSQQLRDARFVEFIYRVINHSAVHRKSTHVEKLFSSLENNSVINFKSKSTYSSSLISVDESLFVYCMDALLSPNTKSKNIFVDSRRRGNFLIISLYSKRAEWLKADLRKIINSYRHIDVTKGKYQLSEIAAYFMLSVLLESMSISISYRKINNKDKLYVKVPISKQLNVFDSGTVEE